MFSLIIGLITVDQTCEQMTATETKGIIVKMLSLIHLPRKVFLLFNAPLKIQLLQNKIKKVKRKTRRYKKEQK